MPRFTTQKTVPLAIGKPRASTFNFGTVSSDMAEIPEEGNSPDFQEATKNILKAASSKLKKNMRIRTEIPKKLEQHLDERKFKRSFTDVQELAKDSLFRCKHKLDSQSYLVRKIKIKWDPATEVHEHPAQQAIMQFAATESSGILRYKDSWIEKGHHSRTRSQSLVS